MRFARRACTVTSALALLLALGAASRPARADTFTVTNTADSGAGSLAQAVTDANDTPGADTIVFAIPGAGPHVIVTPGLTLTDTVTIDGYTQPGASPNTLAEGNDADLRIVLDGEGTFTAGVGVRLLAGTDGSVVRGLSIVRHGTGGTGGGITSPGGVTVEGCWVGIDPSGAPLGNGGTGIAVGGGSVVGGSSPAARNLVSGSGGTGIQVGGDGTRVQGNYVGTDPDGFAARGNAGAGLLLLFPTNARIGGAAPGEGNLISGNGGDGITLQGTADGTVIEGNRVGAARDLTLPLPNQGRGLLAADPGDIRVGPLPSGGAPQGGLAAASGGAANGADCCADLEERVAALEAAGGNTFAYNRLGGVRYDCLSSSLAGVLAGNGFLRNGSRGLESSNCTLEATQNLFAANEAGAAAALGFQGQVAHDGNVVTPHPAPVYDNAAGPSPDGFTPDDPGDVDSGPNGLLNAAVVESVTLIPSEQRAQLTYSYSGVVEAAPYRMQVYSNRGTADGESALETFVQEAPFATDAQGQAAGTLALQHPSFATNSEVCVVVLDDAGNSSEESCARDGAPIGTHVRIDKTPDGGFVRPGETVLFDVVVTNFGTDDVFDLEVRDRPLLRGPESGGFFGYLAPAERVPENADPGPGSDWRFEGSWSSCVEDVGWFGDSVLSRGLEPIFACRLDSLPAGASASFRVPMRPIEEEPSEGQRRSPRGLFVNRVDAFLGGSRLDGDLGRVDVSAGADLAVAASAPETANPLEAFLVDVAVTNQGPETASQASVAIDYDETVFQMLGAFPGTWFCLPSDASDVLCQDSVPIGDGETSGFQIRLRGRSDATGAHAVNVHATDARTPDYAPDDAFGGVVVRFGGAEPVGLLVDPDEATLPPGAQQDFSAFLCPTAAGGAPDPGSDVRPGTSDDDCAPTAGRWVALDSIGGFEPEMDAATSTFTAGDVPKSGAVRVQSGGLEATADVTVGSPGLLPEIDVTPTTIDLGPLRAGTAVTESQLVTVQNLGTGDLLVTGIALGSGGDFALADLPALPASLGSGESFTFRVDFAPEVFGSFATELSIESNDPDEATVTVPVSGEAFLDNDGDGIPDPDDNCRLDANPDQRDSNGDGDGNLCDPDLNDDGTTNFGDLAAFRPRFLTGDADADLNGDGIVNFLDLALFSSGFFQPPGPGRAGPGEPDIVVGPRPVDLGEVDFRDLAGDVKLLSIQNVGDQDLVITSVSDSGAAGWRLLGLPSLPFTVAPGESETFLVNFVPFDGDAEQFEFRIHSNDPDEPSATVSATARIVFDTPPPF